MYSSVDTIWVLLGAALVFFMQAGFAMVETGLTRAKNAGNIIMKNLMDFALGTVAFWLAGFGIMFAGDGALIGGFDPFILGDYSSTFPSWAFVIFQTVFCATAATIVSGAMAERTKFLAYCIYSGFISAIVYPIEAGWVWNSQGWLVDFGYVDFAGSSVIHMVGGLSALLGAWILGPRLGKYTSRGDGSLQQLEGMPPVLQLTAPAGNHRHADREHNGVHHCQVVEQKHPPLSQRLRILPGQVGPEPQELGGQQAGGAQDGQYYDADYKVVDDDDQNKK